MFWKEFRVFPQRTITDIFCNGFISRGFQSFFELNVFFFGEAYSVTPRSVFFFFHDSMSFYCVVWSLRNFSETNYRTEKFSRSGVVRDAHPHLQNAVLFFWKRYVVTVFFCVLFHVFSFYFAGRTSMFPAVFAEDFRLCTVWILEGTERILRRVRLGSCPFFAFRRGRREARCRTLGGLFLEVVQKHISLFTFAQSSRISASENSLGKCKNFLW